MRGPVIILTGGTGALGKTLIKQLIDEDPSMQLVLFIRAKSQDNALSRYRELGFTESYAQKIMVIQCDLSKPDLGLDPKKSKDLYETTTHILHSAASTRFTLPLPEARRNNVETTNRMLAFAKRCHKLKRFMHVSTAFVAGNRTGTIYENELEHKKGFLNTYEQSKYEAEILVNKSRSLPITIVRPSLVLTTRQPELTGPQNALALGISLASRGFLPILPGKPDNKLDIIDGEYASRAITKILLKNCLQHNCYHITNADESPSIGQIIKLIEKLKGRHLPLRFAGDLKSFHSILEDVTKFRPDRKLVYKKVSSFLPELASPKLFVNHHLLDELDGSLTPKPILDEIRQLLS